MPRPLNPDNERTKQILGTSPDGKPFGIGYGRQKGAKNKVTIEIKEKLDQWGVDPFYILAQLALTASVEIRFAAAKELAQYVAPKKKSTEVYKEVRETKQVVFSWAGQEDQHDVIDVQPSLKLSPPDV